ncbi:hypothetical protein VOLCADRAFT_95646 [Volvox carteri f. nagariensis]|uniref:Fungal lipase-type domain-containing protein n=1 Tax=Volvox carteri f. nagariensis TaxID=3068 RepID=D8U7V8_VOLCA|nr:uncharacterized protein VOLCADRAFT_95646 [Volvox carteri f. nagariensis]EFJ44160.1 hypothetical protein VOLCADRAFT_95646 [Volvox carteri f. nagariensis]|eukprot:XP_002954754.1 hypothetical protein VOLCADRAFT_95646 [Volvox carteri f. nagariensis]
MRLGRSTLMAMAVVVVMLLAAAEARQAQQLDGVWYESLSASDCKSFKGERNEPSTSQAIPAVFRNGAWSPGHSTSRNAYIAALLSKDVYFKHVIEPHAGRAARHNFTLFAQLFCRAMVHLGADDCEVAAGAEALVWAVVRAGPSVMLVVRGSNSPQNWITDLASFRRINVADFGGGVRGTNVAQGFYQVFAANRRHIINRVRAAMDTATEAAAAAAAAVAPSTVGGRGSGAYGSVVSDDGHDGHSPRLWVFGHSLGGAVALMAASYLAVQEGLTPTGVYTFGCPRAGDHTWEQAYKLHDVTLRLENAGDIVPALPFGSAWRHVGSAAPIQACRSLQPQPPPPPPVTALVTAAEGETVRQLRGADEGAGGREDDTIVATAKAESNGMGTATDVAFPFPPRSFRDHWVQTYVLVMWSCLPESDQDLVPGPEDLYDRLDTEVA